MGRNWSWVKYTGHQGEPASFLLKTNLLVQVHTALGSGGWAVVVCGSDRYHQSSCPPGHNCHSVTRCSPILARLPATGSSCFGSSHGPCGSHSPEACGTSPRIHTMTPLRSAHWFDPFFALLPPYYSFRKSKTDAYPFPDKDVVNGCIDSAGHTLWNYPGPRYSPGMFLLLMTHLLNPTSSPWLCTISGSQTQTERYWPTPPPEPDQTDLRRIHDLC